MVKVKKIYSKTKNIIGKRPKLFLVAVGSVALLLVAVSVFGVVRKSKLASANNKLATTVQPDALGPQPTTNEPVVKPNTPDNSKTSSSGNKKASCKSQPPLATSKEYRSEVERHGKKVNELKKYWLAHGGLKSEGFTNAFKAEVELNKKNMAKLKSSAPQDITKPKC